MVPLTRTESLGRKQVCRKKQRVLFGTGVCELLRGPVRRKGWGCDLGQNRLAGFYPYCVGPLGRGMATPESQEGMGRRETSGPNQGVGVTEREEPIHLLRDLWSTPVFQALFSELWVRPWIKQRQGWRLEKTDALVMGCGCREWVLGGASRGKDSRGETAGLRLVFILQAAGPGSGRADGTWSKQAPSARGKNTTSWEWRAT